MAWVLAPFINANGQALGSEITAGLQLGEKLRHREASQIINPPKSEFLASLLLST
ncbi:hypothetical protein [Nostoc sp.]|uniref:hypothetical protein n=1 Tax=Nostoc sp. TaxID=1180 RepID=UPI002FF71866